MVSLSEMYVSTLVIPNLGIFIGMLPSLDNGGCCNKAPTLFEDAIDFCKCSRIVNVLKYMVYYYDIYGFTREIDSF